MFADERMVLFKFADQFATIRQNEPENEELAYEVYLELMEHLKMKMRDQLRDLVNAYYARHVLYEDVPINVPFPKRRTMIRDEEYALGLCTNYLVYMKLKGVEDYDTRYRFVEDFMTALWMSNRDQLDEMIDNWMDDSKIVEQVKRDIAGDKNI